jgi:hypothetical protein
MESAVPVMEPVALTAPIAVTIVLAATHDPLKREKRAIGPVGVPETVSCVPEMLPVKDIEPVPVGQ